MKILIVDDEKDFVDLIQTYLEHRDYEVVTAPDGKQGLEKAREHKPNLIIMDINMPHMDGFHAYQALREAGSVTEKIPVIILSARVKMKDLFDQNDIYMHFVEKPLQLDDLLFKVREVLRQGSGGRDRMALIIGTRWLGLKPTLAFLQEKNFTVSEIQNPFLALEIAIRKNPNILVVSTSLEEIDIVDYGRIIRRFPSLRKTPFFVYDLANITHTAPSKVEGCKADRFVECQLPEDLVRHLRDFVTKFV